MTTIECDATGRMGYVISQFKSALQDMSRFNASPGYSNNGAQEYTYACGMFRMMLEEEVLVMSALCPKAVYALRSELKVGEISEIYEELAEMDYTIYRYGNALLDEVAAVRKANRANAEKERMAAAEEALRIARERLQRERLARTCPYCGKEFAHLGTKNRHVDLSCKAAPEMIAMFKEAFQDLGGRAFISPDAAKGMYLYSRQD